MARKCYVQIDGVLYDKEELAAGHGPSGQRSAGSGRGPAVLPDLPDFVSPIDGRVYCGRTGLRDHCARHDVVPTADLAGLPTSLPTVKPNRAEIREKLVELMHTKGYFREQL